MRLIDADSLLNRMQEDPLFDLVERYGVSGVIEAEPTVDAVPVEDHKIIVEKARREAYHSGYKQGRFDEFIEAQYGRGDYDIVPVCRCKDCKHWKNEDEVFIDEWGIPDGNCIYLHEAQSDDFCSRAERKEE